VPTLPQHFITEMGSWDLFEIWNRAGLDEVLGHAL
jgi:hypothetical protein